MKSSCMRCGKETGEGELCCAGCQAISGTPRRKGLWIFTISFSSLVLLLAGLVLWHGGVSFGDFSLDRIWEKPAAVINGESIPRAELKTRVRTVQTIVERQHGREIFAGDRGRLLMTSLENEILNGMLEEKLVFQEAGKMGILVTDEKVNEKLDQITKEVFGTQENFEARLKEDQMSGEDLRNNVRYLLVLEALKQAKTPSGADPEVSFNAWLTQAKQKSELVRYNSQSGGFGNFWGGGCCRVNGTAAGSTVQPGTAGQVDPGTERDARKAGLEAFQKANPGEKDVTASVTDYGCHVQVDIRKNGKVIKSYSYQGGKALEIS